MGVTQAARLREIRSEMAFLQGRMTALAEKAAAIEVTQRTIMKKYLDLQKEELNLVKRG